MAQPILVQPPHHDPREELRLRVERAPASHAEAVLAAYEVLQGLHDSGVLELLRGLLGSRDKVLENVVDAARTPEATRIIRNLLNLTKALAAIEPELLDGLVLALPEAIADAKAQAKDPPTLWGIVNKFRSKDLRRGLVVINSLLEAWGRDFVSDHSGSVQSKNPVDPDH